MGKVSAIVLAVASLVTITFVYDRATRGIRTRLVTERSPKSRFELVQAKQYDTPARADGVDIVFLHGLGSNPDTTWRARAMPEALEETSASERYVIWVSDFLPADLSDHLRDIRLFFYNYDSYWKRDSLNTRRSILGKELLDHIKSRIRTTESSQNRSLIFVAYSYGGLVVKQALVRAQIDPEFSFIVESTTAVLFLGTPHRGSAFSMPGRLWARLLWPLGSNTSLLADLDYDSTSLRDLHDEFCVIEQSAAYSAGPNVHNIGLSVNHFDLNRFSSRDENYQSILSKLLEATSSSTVSVKHFYSVPLETVESYTQRESPWRELEDKMCLRHDHASILYGCVISGLGGVGKSQLALKYAETHKHRYNPILWIDASDAESLRSSFQRCAVELDLPASKWSQNQGSGLVDDAAIRAVLWWLRDRSEADDEWLVIVDNADDLGVGVKQIMPKGERGSVIITSRDELSLKLIPRGCEKIQIGDMSSEEATTLLLHYLGGHADEYSEAVTLRCKEVVHSLGYLALAVDLAGAYIGADSDPATALTQYLEDFITHRDELLQMDAFRGLKPTEKTVWTVWDTTLEKIRRDNPNLHPDRLLTLLAHFKGTIIQDEIFRLASLSMPLLKGEAGPELPLPLREFFQLHEERWDSYQYRESCKVLLRYNMLKRVDGDWPGLTMHGLVKWRALKTVAEEKRQHWRGCHLFIILAVCDQITANKHRPEFRRHLMVHLPLAAGMVGENVLDSEVEVVLLFCLLLKIAMVYYDEGRHDDAETLMMRRMEMSKLICGADHLVTMQSMSNLAAVYRNQGRWVEAEKLQAEVLAMGKEKFGADSFGTPTNMSNLALIYCDQGRWDKAEKLQLEALAIRKEKLGADHPDTLTSMDNLAVTYGKQGRLDEAEKLQRQALTMRKDKLGSDHYDTLTSMDNLASILWNQDRWDQAEKLQAEVLATLKEKLGADHPGTLQIINNLALTLGKQGRWDEAEKLQVAALASMKEKLGADHPDILIIIDNLSLTYSDQGRLDEAEKLQVEVLATMKQKLGEDHPSTLTAMNNLALSWKRQGRHEEALALMKDCIRGTQRVFGPDHPDTLVSLKTLKAWS
ncbi:hypothetical protein GQ53DRAFT_823630 [Thozetella sp. PMI_491]|nr:hypothetical protein GQ53DRAFT_823630 [Thozetella sp. PMI_491]